MKKTIAAIAVTLLAVSLTGCMEKENAPDAQSQGQALTEEAFKNQSNAVPYPADQLTDSLERRNLAERLIRTNDPSVQGYVYLMNFGTIVGYYNVKGKVSSTQSQMTTDQLIEYGCDDALQGCQVATVNAPGDDGSYGANEQGIFFFTTEGAMVTTSLDYIWSDEVLPIDVPRLNADK
jgi:predicted small secreted protein